MGAYLCAVVPKARWDCLPLHLVNSRETQATVCSPCKGSPPLSTEEFCPHSGAVRRADVQLPQTWGHTFLLAVLAWATLQLIDCYVPVLSFVRSWCLLCCVFMIAFFQQNRADDPVIETTTVDTEVVAEDHTKALSEFLAELQARFGEEVSPCLICEEDDRNKLRDWHDASRPGVQLFLKFPRQPDHLLINVALRIRDQVPCLPLIDAQGEALHGGLIPIFCAPALWPTWLPFCESTRLLRNISLGQEIWQLNFRCAFVTADCIVYLSLCNRLEQTGSIDVVIGSPDIAMEGRHWLGAKVPKRTAQLRVPVRSCRISLWPTGVSDGVAQMQVDLIDLLKIKWIHLLFWRTMSTWALPTVAKMHARFKGSALDRYYNGGFGCNGHAEERRTFLDMAQQIRTSFAESPPRPRAH